MALGIICPEDFTLRISQRDGRPLCDRIKLVRAFIAKAIWDIPTTRDLVERLKVDRQMRNLCGWVLIHEIPSESTFSRAFFCVNRHSTVTHPQEGGTGGEVSEILFFSAKSKRRPSLIYSMQIIPVCLSIVARRKGVSATRRGGLNWTPISLLVGHPCKLFHTSSLGTMFRRF